MRIIVESGATKSDWRLVDDGGTQLAAVLQPGINASVMQEAELATAVECGADALVASAGRQIEVGSVAVYVAGAVDQRVCSVLCNAFRQRFTGCSVDVQSDLLAAARALFGRGSGIVCIMGTGANCCFYDGASLSQKVYSGGFILGDEGSAAALGKRFLADFLKNKVPADMADAFRTSFPSDYKTIVENVYRSARPSRYLGSLAPFITERYSTNPYAKSIVDANFNDFLDNFLCNYDTAAYPVGVVGSFAFACRHIVSDLALQRGIRISTFLASPMDAIRRL